MICDLIHHAKILIVDDEIANVRLLEKILAAEGYRNVSMTTDSRDAANMFVDNEPDMVLLDLNMPHQNGYDVMATLSHLIPAKAFLPVIILTADATPASKRRALGGGATDFICKPFDNLEVALRIKNLLRTRFLHLEMQNQNQILDERVRERTTSLETALTELHTAQKEVVQQERLRALGMMATGIVHDFNNVLSLITGYSQLLLKENDSSEIETRTTKYLRTVISAARDGARMVSRLAQFQRPHLETDMRQALSLVELIGETVNLTMPRWKAQARAIGTEITIVTELENVPDIHGDPVEIRELFTNMIFNAVDAMPDGGTITFRTRTQDQSVLLEIEDTGTGMTEEVRQRCLEPFFTTKGEGGSGLGLAMIYGIIQRLDGGIEIETLMDQGTKFRIRLPYLNKKEMNADEVPMFQSSNSNEQNDPVALAC
jgi:signal transduction histidine kinase